MHHLFRHEPTGIHILSAPSGGPVTDTRVLVHAGTRNEVALGDYGCAHALEHMLFKGTSGRSAMEINRLAAGLGHSNAGTGETSTCFYLDHRPADFDLAIDLLFEQLFDSRLDEQDLVPERTVILEELQTEEDNPITSYFRRAEEAFLGPRGHAPLGTRESLAGLTAERLRAFCRREYLPERMLVSVVGGPVQPESILAAVDRNATRWGIPARPSTTVQRSVAPLLVDFTEVRLQHPGEQSVVGLWFEGSSLQQPLRDRFAEELLANALGGGMHSLLWARLREELGLCYQVGACNPWRDELGYFLLYVMLDQVNADAARSEMLGCLHQVAEKGVPADLLDIARRNLLFGHAQGADSAGGRAGQMTWPFFGLGCRVESYPEIEAAVLGATADQVQAVACRLASAPCKIVQQDHGERP